MIKLIKEMITRRKMTSCFANAGGVDLEWFRELPIYQMKEVVDMLDEGWNIDTVKYLCGLNKSKI